MFVIGDFYLQFTLLRKQGNCFTCSLLLSCSSLMVPFPEYLEFGQFSNVEVLIFINLMSLTRNQEFSGKSIVFSCCLKVVIGQCHHKKTF